MNYPQTMYVQLVEVENYDLRQAKRSQANASCLVFLSWLFLGIAASAPLWVVTSLTGEGKVGLLQVNLDLHVGTGIFMKNVCYGSSTPDESFLNSFGLSCNGAKTCEETGTNENGRTTFNCDDYIRSAQILSIFSMNLLFLALMFSCCGRMFISGLCAFFGSIMAVVTLIDMEQSDLMNKDWKCTTVLGATLCENAGASVALQAVGIVFGFFGCFSYFRSHYHYRASLAPLIFERNPQGVIIV